MSHRAQIVVPWVAAAALLALAGCRGRDVVVRAGKTEVRVAEFELFRVGGASTDARLDRLAERALLAEAARRDGLDADPTVRARIDAAVREIRAQAFLEKSLGGATRDDVLRRLYLEKKEQLGRRRVHVAQIALHARTPEERAQAQSRASLASARLAGGEPFEKVAGELSEDRTSAARGGDLGPVLEGQVDTGFFEAAAKLKRGEVSAPIETPFGYHVLRALEDPQTVTPTFEEAKGVLAAQARRDAEAALLLRLRSDIGVKTWPERVPASATPGNTPREGK